MIKKGILLKATASILFLFLFFQVNIGLILAAGEPSCSLTFSHPSGSAGYSTSFIWSSSNDADGLIPYSCSGNIGSGYLDTPNGNGTITVNESQTCTLTVVNSDNLLRTCQASVGVIVDNGDDRVISAIEPQSISAGGSVKISGNNLGQQIYISNNIGDVSALVGLINSEKTEVVFTVPTTIARGTYMVKVGPNSTDVSNELPLTITSGAPPVITSISPEKAGLGQTVIIYGTNLTHQIQLQKTGGILINITGTANESLTEVQFEFPLDIVGGRYKVTVVSTDGNAVSPKTLEVTIGGSTFRNPQAVGAPTQGLPTNLGQLISQIFTWSLGILGISVFVMFFYSGFLWLTAAGNTSKIGEAKTHMTNAVFGAILLLSSYLILYTINPDFVKDTFNLPGLGLSKTIPTPEGTCIEEPFPVDSLLSDLQAERANFGAELTHEEAGTLLNAVAWANKDDGWGLLSKPGGNNCPIPDGSLISCDYLVHEPSLLGLDALVAAPGTKEDGTLENGASTPTWGDGCKVKANEWLAPVQP